MSSVSARIRQFRHKSLFVILFTSLITPTISLIACGAETVETTHTEQASSTPAFNLKALRRFDFRVTNKSCPTCLHHMQDRMKELPGAVKVAVMLQKPYGAVVIYDSSKLTVEKILDKAREGLPDVEFDDKTDIAIKSVPIVIVPAAAASGKDTASK